MASYSKTPKEPEAQPAPLLKKEGHCWLKKHNIPYEVRPDGVTVVKGDVSLEAKGIRQLPFRDIVPWEVGGDFNCRGNRLTSLNGAPQSVTGSFNCNNNLLTSLAGAPLSVGGDFCAHGNQLTNLVGSPQTVGRNFDCSYGRLTSLVGAPQYVGGDFWCRFNLLADFAGLELSKVTGNIKAGKNSIVSLEGLPAEARVEGLPEGITAAHLAVQELEL